MMDFYYFSHRKESSEIKVLVDPACEEKIRSITGNGKAALILTAHLGNWELLCGYLRRFGKISLIARDQKDFDRYVVECRNRYGIGTIHDSSSNAQLISDILARGEMVIFIFDRNLSHTKGIITKFIGYPAFTPYFPVNIAMNGHVPVVGAFLTQEGRNYRLHIEDPIEVKPLQDKEETYRYYVKIFLDLTEKYIRLYPDQWFWAHKRWGRPKGDVAFK
jgi:KDO2-lipid IV(A) lauroyltransferase